MSEMQPTPDGGASHSDPVDRIQAYLDSEDGNSAQEAPAQNETKTPDEPDDGAQGKDEGPQFTTSHLAQHLGLDESAIDVDEEGQPVFKTKIDGKESPVKFADLLKSYQLSGHAENRAREAAEREKAAERKLQEADQQIQQRHQHLEQNFQQLQALTAVAREELAREYNSINWAALRQEDPGRAALLEVEFQKRDGRIQNVFREIDGRRSQAAQEAERQRQINEVEAKQAQSRRLLSLVPEWKDPAIFNKERGEILEWVGKIGLDPAEIDLNRAASVFALRKAWQQDTLQKSKPAIEHKLRTAPKLAKPGAAPSNDGNSAQLKSLKQQVKTTGGNSTKAVAAWLEATGKA